MTDDAWAEIRSWRAEMEKRVTKLETDRAVEAERYANIIRRLDKIEGGMSKLLWLVIAIIAGGIMNFIMNGGLNVPTP
jgi:hypothetical protein